MDALLVRAPVGAPCDASSCDMASLTVVGKCPCGCASLFFTGIDDAVERFRLADGLGYTDDGEETGMILWASGARIVHLELYNYSERPALLPSPASIRSLEEAPRNLCAGDDGLDRQRNTNCQS